MNRSPTELPLIDDERGLQDLVARLNDSQLLAIDTEFVREKTYYPELALIQIATDDVIAAVDCMAELDLTPLCQIMAAANSEWLLHSARQDLEVLAQPVGSLPGRLTDTQIAAALLGHSLQIGLKDLLQTYLEVSISKELTRTNWARRPLPDAAIEYALDDVRYLRPVWQLLQQELEAKGRLSWFEEDCRRQLEIPLQPDTKSLFERTRGTGSLRGPGRAAGMALMQWREQRAQQRDRPRRWILADEHLLAIATALPSNRDELQRVEGLAPALVQRQGSAILATIRDAEPVTDPDRKIPPDKALIKSLQAEIKDRAESLGIQPELLAARRDIARMAAGEPPELLTSGWRQGVLADLTERFTSGRE